MVNGTIKGVGQRHPHSFAKQNYGDAFADKVSRKEYL